MPSLVDSPLRLKSRTSEQILMSVFGHKRPQVQRLNLGDFKPLGFSLFWENKQTLVHCEFDSDFASIKLL